MILPPFSAHSMQTLVPGMPPWRMCGCNQSTLSHVILTQKHYHRHLRSLAEPAAYCYIDTKSHITVVV